MVPALAWIPNLASSVGRALGCLVEHDVRPTVNPLLYTIRLTFGEQQDGKTMLRVWNLLQLYAAKNDVIPQGRVDLDRNAMTIKVGVKTKRGQARDERPW